MGLQQIDTLVISNQWQLISFNGKQILISGDEHYPELTQHIDVLGVAIRTVKSQVAAGRNLAVLVEAAVRNTILQLRGIDTLKEFMERQRSQMNAEAESSKSQGRLI